MDNQLQWFFDLVDRMSGPAKEIDKNVNTLDKDLKKVQDRLAMIKGNPEQFKAIMEGRKEIAKLTKEARGSHESFRHQLFETVVIAAEVGEAFMRVAEGALEMGKEIVNAAAKSEQMEVALKNLLPAGDDAAEFMEKLEILGAKIGTKGSQLQSESVNLLAAGFNKKDSISALATAHDVAARTANPANAEATIGLFSNMKTVGALSERSLKQLRELRINRDQVTANLAAAYGVKTNEVKKLIAAGKISSDEGIKAIELAVAKSGGGVSGALAGQHGKTVAGLMTTIGDIPEQMFAAVRTTAGFESFRGFLENIVDLAGPGSEFQKSVTAAIGGVMETLFGGLSGEAGAERLKSILNRVVEVIKGIPGALREGREQLDKWYNLINNVIKTVEVFTVVLGGAALVMGTVSAATAVLTAVATAFGVMLAILTSPITAVIAAAIILANAVYLIYKNWDELVDFFKDIGTKIVDGLVNGITNKFHEVKQAFSEMGEWAKDGIKGVLQIHSPSRVFEGLGMMTGQGFADGIDKSSDVIDLAARRAMKAPGLDAGRAGSAAGVSVAAPNINITISVDGAGKGNSELAQEIAAQIRTMLPDAIASAGEQLAMEMGAA